MKHSLKLKLVLLISIISVFAVSIIGLFATRTAVKLLTKSTEENLLQTADSSAKQVQAYVDTEFAKIHSYAKFSNMTAKSSYSEAELAAKKDILDKGAFFIPYYSQYPDKYENIAFYDKDGFVALPNGKIIQLANKPYITGPCNTGKDYIDNPRFSTVNNQVLMFLSTVVKDENKNAIGCIVTVLRGNVINKIAEGVDVVEGFHPIIVDKTKNGGEVLTALDIPEDRKDEYSQFLMDLSEKGRKLTTFKDPITGAKMLSVACDVEGYDWTVLCVAPYNAFFGSIPLLRMKIVTFGLLAIIVLVIISILFINMTTRPLRNLRESMDDIATGNADLTKRITNSTKDEIGDVIIGFNNFTGKLQNIITDIRNSKESLITVGDILNNSAGDTSASLDKIFNSIQSVHKQINNSTESVQATASAVNEISANIGSFEKMLKTQIEGETSASTAVEQMLSNIASVTRSMDTMAASFEGLYKYVS